MRYIIRRVVVLVITMWTAMTVNFFLPHMMPGSPADSLRSQLASRGHTISTAQIEKYLSAFGFQPHQNILQQYVSYLKDMVTLHWGVSIGNSLGTPVIAIIRQALPWTLVLVGLATLIAFGLGTLIGMIAAWHRGGLFDSVMPPLFVVMSALPYFWVGLVAIDLLANGSGAPFPSDGNYTLGLTPGWSLAFIGSVIAHGFLPALTIVITTLGGWILTMRNNMISVLAEDYIKMARAKGLPNTTIMFNYAARNAFLPNLSGFAMSLGYVISGAILVEYIFNYPGLGHLFFMATVNSDFPLLDALFLILTLAVLICVFLVDMVTLAMDPRTRSAR